MRRALPLALLVSCAAAPAAHAAGDPLRARQWGLDMVRAQAAHSVTTGSGATVAIIDSGVRADHPDLQGRLLAGRDFVDGDGTPNDENGHGTHVLGIAGAATDNGVGIASVAPGANMLPVRVLDADGSGTDRDIAAGIDWAVAQGADVINLSLGDFLPLAQLLGIPSETDAAIERAHDAGRVVVAAAGNNGLPLCEQASDRKRLLCVGAVDRRGRRSAYSSFAQGRGVMAPGGSAAGGDEDILSTWGGRPDYLDLAGTSQAAPHVAGIAALLVSVGVTGQQAVDRIMATARDAGARGPDSEYGHGIADAAAAVDGLRRADPPSGGDGDRTAAGTRQRRPRVQMARGARASTILRQGLRVRCTPPHSGRCRVSIFHGGRRIATGVRQVGADRRATVRVRTTAVGRRVLRRAIRRDQRLTARVRVSATDARTNVRRLRIVG